MVLVTGENTVWSERDVWVYCRPMTAKLFQPLDEEPISDLVSRRSLNPRQRILVVEDEAMIRRLNTEVLSYSGYQVDAAADGDEAWEALQQNHYDLVVTDQDMPGLTGVGLIKKLYAARMAMPVIMATGSYPRAELELHPWLQVEAALLKPYSYDELLDTVKNVLHAFNHGDGHATPPPNWMGQPLPNGLRL